MTKEQLEAIVVRCLVEGVLSTSELTAPKVEKKKRWGKDRAATAHVEFEKPARKNSVLSPELQLRISHASEQRLVQDVRRQKSPRTRPRLLLARVLHLFSDDNRRLVSRLACPPLPTLSG